LAVLVAVAVLYGLVLDAGYDDARARAMAFTALVLGNAALILTNRSGSRSLLTTLAMPNRALWWVVGGALGGLAAALYVAPLQQIFGFEALEARDLFFCLIAASAGVFWSEIVKLLPKGKMR
jgi:Ca2+-transporting ATPase